MTPQEVVDNLANKAADAKNPGAACGYSQAALNIAQASATMARLPQVTKD